jgi:hypothetical protein
MLGVCQFLPGQWVDAFVPGISKPGGFTITSPPSKALEQPRGAVDDESRAFVELAIQTSPDNPPAAWFWQPAPTIIGSTIRLRVGGSFVFPPPLLDMSSIKHMVFIAGGVGINPLMSMLSHMAESMSPFHVQLLYSTKLPGTPGGLRDILFLERLRDLFHGPYIKGRVRLFLTGAVAAASDWASVQVEDKKVEAMHRRFGLPDLIDVLGSSDDKAGSVIYLCGTPSMTDECLRVLPASPLGIDPTRVFCEKWW